MTARNINKIYNLTKFNKFLVSRDFSLQVTKLPKFYFNNDNINAKDNNDSPSFSPATVPKPLINENEFVNYDPLMELTKSRNNISKLNNIFQEMKSKNIKPGATAYNILLEAYSRYADSIETTKILHDMLEGGIKPNLETINIILKTCAEKTTIFRQDPSLREFTFDLINQFQLEPNETTYEYYVDAMIANDEFESAIDFFKTMRKQGLKPSFRLYQKIIKGFIGCNDDVMVLELMKMSENDDYKLFPNMYLDILRVCAYQYNVEGVIKCWDIVTKDGLGLDEGLCINLLNLASVSGETKLATEVLKYLKTVRKLVNLELYHLEPYLEAFVIKGDLKKAFDVLNIIRSSNHVPTMKTISSVVKYIEKSTELIDKAYYTLEELHKEGKKVDILAFTAIIIACKRINNMPNSADLKRAVETFKSIEKFGIKPDLDTFNALINVTIYSGHKELGEEIFNELKEAYGLKPNIDTYRRMIFLCLNQPNYEDAFKYLEEMKSKDILPSIEIYERIIRKCVMNSDARAKIALEEMCKFGYRPTTDITDSVKFGVLVDRSLKKLLTTTPKDNNNLQQQRRYPPQSPRHKLLKMISEASLNQDKEATIKDEHIAQLDAFFEKVLGQKN
ncbi:489_t:CDS:2 [Entrophospora sp. SA101]|nr:7352_t:CDS:2 [Entrophospora sp. SA101]CAJ0836539.1 489_t:CDS:2 [Entrophospora sp. SA101]